MKHTKFLWLALALALLLTCGSVVTVFATESDETLPPEETPAYDLWILGKNLALEDSVYIYYAVPVEGINGADVKLLLWTAPLDAYTYGTQRYELSPEPQTTMVDDIECYVFNFKGLAAKHMTVDVYSRVYVEDETGAYYSDLDKYSILQYCYNMLGKTGGAAPEEESLENLLNILLEYGAAAQIRFNNKTDRLANDHYYQIKVSNALLSDGSNHGLYLPGEQLTVTANEKNAAGEDFLYWQNSSEEQVGQDLTYTITVGEKNETYTAVYGEKAPEATDESYFIFTELSDGTYSVKAKDVNNMPAEVVIPATYNGKAVTSIANYAFQNCTTLTSITIPDSVTSIGDSAFYGCTSLTSITIPNSVTSIDEYAFRDCISLTGITLPDGVTSIGDSTFYGCISLISLTIPNSVTSIGDSAFSGCTSLASITISDRVLSIGDSAFYNCASLISITIPDSVTSIGKSTFYYCSNLANITLGNGITRIGGHAFFYCTNLASITIPDSVTIIGDCAFCGCTSLTNITIPDSVIDIGSNAFSDCTNLANVYITDLKSWCKISFSDPGSSPMCYDLYLGNELVTELEIPDSVTNIRSGTFRNCKSITKVTILDSVKSIDVTAFYNCTSLESVTIGNGVTSIGSYAFYNCASLTSVTIPDSVTNIGYYAFSDCTSLASVVIGNSVKNVDGFAFQNCTSLTSITIPDSVTNIGYYAFSDCTSLASVYYTGTAEDWTTISISTPNDTLTTATIYYYSETQPTTEGNYWRYVDGIPTAW